MPVSVPVLRFKTIKCSRYLTVLLHSNGKDKMLHNKYIYGANKINERITKLVTNTSAAPNTEYCMYIVAVVIKICQMEVGRRA